MSFQLCKGSRDLNSYNVIDKTSAEKRFMVKCTNLLFISDVTEKVLRRNQKGSKYLQVLGVVANAVYQLGWLDLASADFVNGGEEWELVLHVLGLQHVVHFLSGNWTLKWYRLSSILRICRLVFTCNFWPFNISFSRSTMLFPVLTKASLHLRLRPPERMFRFNCAKLQ